VIGIVAGHLQDTRTERRKHRLCLFAFGFEIQNILPPENSLMRMKIAKTCADAARASAHRADLPG
jgi:hypothetical protein